MPATEQANFRPRPVASLIDGKHAFVIPSFQRGYRWEEKQVTDLLDDILQFAMSNHNSDSSYYLQPIVVRQCKHHDQDAWEVLDGQQRLTTLLLILKRMMSIMSPDDAEYYTSKLYSITYTNRPKLDFDKPNATDNLDSYYICEAKQVIDDWFKFKREQRINLDRFKECLLYNNVPQVKFIWYAIDANSCDLNNIKIFNRLNKGKIALTSAELIKALFIMDHQQRFGNDAQTSDRLSAEWNEMERRFQDNKFWAFISNNDEGVQTRMDVLFDFVTHKSSKADSDYSYREFQRLYDYCRKCERSANKTTEPHKAFDTSWGNNIRNMDDAWWLIVSTFDRLVAWYEDQLHYHYIGYLVVAGFSLLDIHTHLESKKQVHHANNQDKEWCEEDSIHALRQLMMQSFMYKKSYLTKDAIDEFEYDTHKRYVRNLLLLLNIESYRKSYNLRFDFDQYKKQQWDIEHIDSRNNASIQTFEDRMRWLNNIAFILGMEDDDQAKELHKEVTDIISQFKVRGSVIQSKFEDFYLRINVHYAKESGQDESEVDLKNLNKNSICNLTLLDSKTNREYQDAPYPYKRHRIMTYDSDGSRFIPLATRNVFLKYYTDSNSRSSHLDTMRWCAADRESYLAAIHKMVDPIFDSVIESPSQQANDTIDPVDKSDTDSNTSTESLTPTEPLTSTYQ